MNLLASLQDLLRHVEWADAVVWRTVLGSAPATTDEVVKSRLHARLRELGAEPPLTDFIAWVWFGKPQAEWPGR